MAGGTRLPPRAYQQSWTNGFGTTVTRTFYSEEARDRYAFDEGHSYDFQGGMSAAGLTNDMSEELTAIVEEFQEEMALGIGNFQVKVVECGHRYNVAHNVLTGAMEAFLRDPQIFPSGPPHIAELSSPIRGMPCFAIDPDGRLEGIYSDLEEISSAGQLNSWGSDPVTHIAHINSVGQWFVPFDVNNVLTQTAYNNDIGRGRGAAVGQADQSAFASGRLNQDDRKNMSVVMNRDGLRYYINFLLHLLQICLLLECFQSQMICKMRRG